MVEPHSSDGNVNLRLNRISIDDVIARAALNSGVKLSNTYLETHFDTIRGQYGKKVFSGKVVLVRPDLNVPLKTDEDRKILIVNEYEDNPKKTNLV